MDIEEILAELGMMSDKNLIEERKKRPRFDEQTFFDGLKEGKFKKIVFVTGAGISVSAGIPDFRTPGTGLYDNLKEYELPFPEAIFELGFFNEKPQAFYKLAQSFLDLGKFKATKTHHFCKMLSDKKMVSHYLTQNIDNLESKAGFTEDEINQAHGANRGAHCAKCFVEADAEKLQEMIAEGTVMYCAKKDCGGPVKPDITFFGEQLPDKFMDILQNEEKFAKECDLMIVIGTALAVGPFNSVVSSVECPQVLINMENTKVSGGYDFCNVEARPDRLFIKGKCDDTIEKICKHCGWHDELMERFNKAAGATSDMKPEAKKDAVDDLADQMANLKVMDEKNLTKPQGKDEEKKETDDTTEASSIADEKK